MQVVQQPSLPDRRAAGPEEITEKLKTIQRTVANGSVYARGTLSSYQVHWKVADTTQQHHNSSSGCREIICLLPITFYISYEVLLL